MNKIQKIFIFITFNQIEQDLKEAASISPDKQRELDAFLMFMSGSIIKLEYFKIYKNNIEHLKEMWSGIEDSAEMINWSENKHSEVINYALRSCSLFLARVDRIEMGILEREGYL